MSAQWWLPDDKLSLLRSLGWPDEAIEHMTNVLRQDHEWHSFALIEKRLYIDRMEPIVVERGIGVAPLTENAPPILTLSVLLRRATDSNMAPARDVRAYGRALAPDELTRLFEREE